MSNFITNAPQRTLKGRLNTLIQHSQELKFLVGFFYFSGWQELYEALRKREDLTLKILVGLDTEPWQSGVLEVAEAQAGQLTQEELVERFFRSLRTALRDERLDTPEFYEQAAFFIHMLQRGRLEIRKTFEPNHAKLYLFRLNEEGRALTNSPGRFITGSSNLTRAGMLGQHEFNVEIGDYGWEEAEAYFDQLWRASIPLSESPTRKDRLFHTLQRQTPLAEITPFEAYALVIKTYLDLMEQRSLRPQVATLMEERGYIPYRYQQEAVQQALSVLEEYNGVILADVVGLGKSVIASWLARERNGRGLVICPPALMGDPQTRSTGWYKYLSDFDLHDWSVYSLGALDKAQDYLAHHGEDIATIIVDEAHRFRNEDTEAYERLSQICTNRAVILLTATPFNNAPSDIFALLKLFVPPGKSTLTLDEKLAERFARYHNDFRALGYILRYHNAGGEKQHRAEKYYSDLFEAPLPIDIHRVKRRVQRIADEIRAVIEPVVIRRNRLDLKRDPLYAQEITALSEVADPCELYYELTPQQSTFYDQVIYHYFGEEGEFRGAVYQPFFYEKRTRLENLDEEGNRIYQQQRNLYDFMRRLLVKRFESSFGAFAQSINNFIRVHEHALEFIKNSQGRYILDRPLLEKIYAADAEEIDDALEEFIQHLAQKERLAPRHDRIYQLRDFDDAEGFLQDIQADLDLLRTIAAQITTLHLVEEDPKVRRLAQAVKEILESPPDGGNEPRRKVVIFSEYRDTVFHIAPYLERHLPQRVLFAPANLSQRFYQELVANFDASYPLEKQVDDYDVLIATDKLSEGINLNRAGAVINYDIPWNPTRVIQRLGRINRIGRKVFERLFIYNFFPTEQGATVVQSRDIAAQKLFLIHNTLGEDAKIFAPDETPTPAELFRRVNRNPEEEESESLLTKLRRIYFEMQQEHPQVIRNLDELPSRLKTAKAGQKDELLVFRRKGLQLFVHARPYSDEVPSVRALTLEEALDHINCSIDTPRKPLSGRFWEAYKEIKDHREQMPMPHSEISLWTKAENNLRSALERHANDLQDYLPFIRTLIRDLREFQTLPKYTLRRLTLVEMTGDVSVKKLERFKEELEFLRRVLGEDYLERIERRAKELRSEIIIAIENQRQ